MIIDVGSGFNRNVELSLLVAGGGYTFSLYNSKKVILFADIRL